MLNIKYYSLSMDAGESFLPEIFEYDHDIPNFFEAVSLPMYPIVRDTWLECFEHMQNHLHIRNVKHDQRLNELSNQMNQISDDDVDATEKLTDIIAKIKYIENENKLTQDTMLALVKLYGENYGDVTQDMLEAVSFLSTTRKE